MSLPTGLSLLPFLRVFWADDCHLTGSTLPPCLFEISTLQELHLNGNQFTGIGSDIAKLEKLTVLSLENNKIDSLPLELASIKSLTSLFLRQNLLAELPSSSDFWSTLQLKTLHLSSNKLSSFPTSLLHCSTLTSVYLNGNTISSLPPLLGDASQLPLLSKLQLSNNDIRVLPPEVTSRFGTYDRKAGVLSHSGPGASSSSSSPVVVVVNLGSNPVGEEDKSNGSAVAGKTPSKTPKKARPPTADLDENPEKRGRGATEGKVDDSMQMDTELKEAARGTEAAMDVAGEEGV